MTLYGRKAALRPDAAGGEQCRSGEEDRGLVTAVIASASPADSLRMRTSPFIRQAFLQWRASACNCDRQVVDTPGLCQEQQDHREESVVQVVDVGGILLISLRHASLPSSRSKPRW